MGQIDIVKDSLEAHGISDLTVLENVHRESTSIDIILKASFQGSKYQIEHIQSKENIGIIIDNQY